MMLIKALGLGYLTKRTFRILSSVPNVKSTPTSPLPVNFEFNLIVPPSSDPKPFAFKSLKALQDFVRLYQGTLALPAEPNKATFLIEPSDYQKLSPAEIYEIIS